MVLVFLIISSLLCAQSHNLQQTVRNWPSDSDTGGIHWTVYNLHEAGNKWLKEFSVGSGTNYVPSSNLIVWNANLGNFPGSPPWLPGDSIIAFGSWDSAYAHDPVFYNFNPSHTGFYWLFSDTLTTEEPQAWQPDDTLRVMPKPLAYLQTTTPDIDTIMIRIPNPQETRRADQNVYDVMGYELYAAEHIGNPAHLVMHISYVACQGVFGDTTVYTDLESNYTGSPIFYAYKMVMRPDTTGTVSPEPGHTTEYFSMNSDSIFLDWPGIAPGYMNAYLSRNSDSVAINWVAAVTEPEPRVEGNYPLKLLTTPNPFATSTTISLSGASGSRSIGVSEIHIFDVSGRMVKRINLETSSSQLAAEVQWDAKGMAPGIYFCQVITGSQILTKKLIKIR
jgi:hypothetical protein